MDKPVNADAVDKVFLSPYSADWPREFHLERQRLTDALAQWQPVFEHFGSTAVPGLPAKPIIDMLGGLQDFSAAQSLMNPLIDLGYRFEGSFTERLMFASRDREGRRKYHLHLVEHDGPQWQLRLKFRDALRESADLRAAYLVEKHRLAARYPDDMKSYAAAKGEYLKTLIDEL